MGRAGTKGQPSARVLYAMELLGRMRWSAALKEQMAHFEIGRTQAAYDLAAADEEISLAVKRQMPTLAQRSIERMSRIQDRAEQSGDLRAAVMAQREITRIAGIAAPEKVEHSGSVEQVHNFEDMTQEQIDALAALDRAKAS